MLVCARVQPHKPCLSAGWDHALRGQNWVLKLVSTDVLSSFVSLGLFSLQVFLPEDVGICIGVEVYCNDGWSVCAQRTARPWEEV